MMKIVATLVIFGLCANVCFGAAVTASSNSGAFSSSVLNSSATTILKGTNTTDSPNWDSSCATCGASSAAVDAGVFAAKTWFGPGATNDTSYLWGVPSSGYAGAVTTVGGSCGVAGTGTGGCGNVYTTSAIRKRTINNTIVGWANDTTELSVVSDTSVSTAILGSSWAAGVGPGYLAVLSTGLDTTTTPNYQVWITLIGTTASSPAKLTATADVWGSSSSIPAVGTSCTTTTYGLGNVWYDIGAGAFFYTYWKNVNTAVATSGTAGTCGSFSASGSSEATSIYLGGIYVNGTAYWASPITAAAGGTAGDTIAALYGGGDNWLNSSNIYIAYQDMETSPYSVYYSKTSKASATTAVGSFSQLTKGTSTTPTTGTTVTTIFAPVAVWSSNFTYGITLSNVTTTVVTSPSSTTTTYMYTNFLNGSTTGVDSGLSNSAASAAGTFAGWQLSTGYTIVASWSTGTTNPKPSAYTYATYYGNGTANMTAATLGSTTSSSVQFYEDVNGTQWIGWIDEDTAQSSPYTYNAYLAKFQGQLNVASSSANVLATLSAVALFFAAIFAF